MNRAASAAIVNVLPVPALASSTVTPDGSGPVSSNGRSRKEPRRHCSLSSSTASRRSHSARRVQRPAAARPSTGSPLVGPERQRQQLLERQHPAERAHVIGVDVLAGGLEAGRPRLARSRLGDPGRARRRARMRPPSATAAAARHADPGRADQSQRDRARRPRRRTGPAGSAPPAAPRRCRTAPCRRSPPRTPGAGIGGAERQQPDPRRDPVARVDARVARVQQHAAANPGDRAGQHASRRPASALTPTERGSAVGERPRARWRLGRRSARSAGPPGSRACPAAGSLGRSRRGCTTFGVVSREHAVEQALADLPQLESVEVDRQPVAKLVVGVADRDLQGAGAGTRGRALAERDEIVERHAGCSHQRQRRGQERRRRAGARRSARSHPPASCGQSPTASTRRRSCAGRTRCSGWWTTIRSRASLSATNAVRSTTSSSSPTGTAGGSGALVRSSWPE